MSSWSLQLEGKVFDGVEVVPTSHVNMQDKILNPDPRVCHSVVCLYVHGFESLWKFMIQYLFIEAQRVHSPFVSGHVVACYRLLLCPVLIPNRYSISVIVLVTIIPHRSMSSRSIDGPGRASLFVQELT